MLNPTTKRILRWKSRMNLIVTIYLEGYLQAQDELRDQLPYQLNQEYGILTQEGKCIGQFSMVESQINVHWIASPEHLAHLDTLGMEMMMQTEGAIM